MVSLTEWVRDLTGKTPEPAPPSPPIDIVSTERHPEPTPIHHDPGELRHLAHEMELDREGAFEGAERLARPVPERLARIHGFTLFAPKPPPRL
jgi:hypothetical protein